MLSSASVQEAQDFAVIAHAAALESRIPFLHFFDGFRTSHEISKIELLSEDVLRAMIDERYVFEHRARALSPDHPVLRGTAQNPDVFFQARETVNPFYAACPEIVQRAMNRFAELTGGGMDCLNIMAHANAERVIVIDGLRLRNGLRDGRFLERPRGKGWCAQSAALSAVRLAARLARPFRRPQRRSPSSIAPRSRAAGENRCIWIV